MKIAEGHGYYGQKGKEIHFSPSAMVANFIEDDSFQEHDSILLTKREMRLLIRHVVAETKVALKGGGWKLEEK